MMREKTENEPIIIDLTGPDGNAFVLIGYANDWARQLEYSEDRIQALNEDLTSSDYENLIKVFDNHFGEFVTLLR